MKNSDYNYVNEEYAHDRRVEGFQVAFTCKENFRQTDKVSTCNSEGKWLPVVECIPG